MLNPLPLSENPFWESKPAVRKPHVVFIASLASPGEFAERLPAEPKPTLTSARYKKGLAVAHGRRGGRGLERAEDGHDGRVELRLVLADANRSPRGLFVQSKTRPDARAQRRRAERLDLDLHGDLRRGF